MKIYYTNESILRFERSMVNKFCLDFPLKKLWIPNTFEDNLLPFVIYSWYFLSLLIYCWINGKSFFFCLVFLPPLIHWWISTTHSDDFLPFLIFILYLGIRYFLYLLIYWEVPIWNNFLPVLINHRLASVSCKTTTCKIPPPHPTN